MTPTQEAFIECLSQGMSTRAACRRIGVSAPAPYKWASESPEFHDAWMNSKLQYRRVVVRGDWVNQLIGDLEYHGFISDATDREALKTCIARFFSDRQVLERGTLRKVFNQSLFSRAEQTSIAQRYIALKKGGATSRDLHNFLVECRVSTAQVGRWARKLFGNDALCVGPYQRGWTKNLILSELAKSAVPLSINELSTRLKIGYTTLHYQATRLHTLGKVRKITSGKAVSYVCA